MILNLLDRALFPLPGAGLHFQDLAFNPNAPMRLPMALPTPAIAPAVPPLTNTDPDRPAPTTA